MVVWIFGYGSLIWKPGFEYTRRMVGFIKGYKRVFYQGSTDHRGTPDAPGRTVTLIEEEGSVTWGAAYCIDTDPDSEKEIISYLEWREKEYDVRKQLHFFNKESIESPALKDVLVYIASSDLNSNKNFLGHAPLHEIANQIAISKGPSGPNFEYLFRLHEALVEISVMDEHVEELAMLVKQIRSKNVEN